VRTAILLEVVVAGANVIVLVGEEFVGGFGAGVEGGDLAVVLSFPPDERRLTSVSILVEEGVEVTDVGAVDVVGVRSAVGGAFAGPTEAFSFAPPSPTPGPGADIGPTPCPGRGTTGGLLAGCPGKARGSFDQISESPLPNCASLSILYASRR
jgi:hypothetical protein